jgi:hypothetical protein
MTCSVETEISNIAGLAVRKMLTARLGEDFSLDSPFHRTYRPSGAGATKSGAVRRFEISDTPQQRIGVTILQLRIPSERRKDVIRIRF